MHLSPNTLGSILEKFIGLSTQLQRIEYHLNGLKSTKLGTVIEALVFKTEQITARFTAQISDLQLISLYQAGQISKLQLQLSADSQFKDMVDQHLTLLRTHDLIESRLLMRIQPLDALLKNGIMDFLVAAKDS